MPAIAKKFLYFASFATISPYFLAGGGDSARAACIEGAQCSIIDGSQITQSGGHFSSTGFDTPAVAASGAGSQIKADNVTIDNGSDPLDFSYFLPVVSIEDGGEIILDSSTINAFDGVALFNPGSQFTMKDGTITIENTALQAYDNSKAQLDNVTINKDGTQFAAWATVAIWDSQLHANGLIMNVTNGLFEDVLSIEYSRLILNDAALFIEGEGMIGLSSHFTPETRIDNLTLDMKGDYTFGIYLGNGSATADIIDLSHLNLTIEGDMSTGISLYGESTDSNINQIQLRDSQLSVQGDFSNVIETRYYSDLALERVKINLEAQNPDPYSAALKTSVMAQISLHDSSIEVENASGAIIGIGATMELDNSHMTATGDINDYAAHGIVFGNILLTDDMNDIPADAINLVRLKNNSSVTANQANAIWANSIDGVNIVDVDNSRIEGDRLISVEQRSNLTLNAHSTKLFGSTHIEMDDAYLNMNLSDDTQWEIHPDYFGQTDAQVSILNLDNSVISFATPADPLNASLYQTLRLGEGELFGRSDVYKASNNASISFNTYLNEGGDLSNQLTDRLLINGDVSGITTININEMTGSPGGETSPSGVNAASEGISLIQVSGQAAANSFQLAGGYVTMNAQPYRYELFAYGPTATQGAADPDQRLVSGSGDYWDFRLQSLAQSGGGGGGFFNNPLVPQAPNYLLTPLGMMQAGLLDLNTLHRRLGDIRSNLAQAKNDKQGEYFLIGYHGNYRYHADLAPSQYGYATDLRYGAAQIGGNLYGFETDKGLARFGLAVSRGNLSLDPRNVAQAQATGFNIWNASGYFTYIVDNGFYLDSILSYGGFGGDVTSQAKGKAAKIGGHSLQASVEIGRPFALGGVAGLEIEPQIQLIYQQFDFNAAYDKADDFTVELGRQQQIFLRVGSHVTKKFVNVSSNRESSLYAKFDYIHAFKKGDEVWLNDSFNIGDFGNHIEVGIGFNTLQSNNMSFYGEASWQQRVGNAGFSGMRLNGGLRVQF